MQESCISIQAAVKKGWSPPADVARFKRSARITVARVSDYSPGKKATFINFLTIKCLCCGPELTILARKMLDGDY
jgi:hypothetical protein